MRWLTLLNRQNLSRMAVSLPLALLAASTLVFINETGYKRADTALQDMTTASATRSSLNRLLRLVLDAETGQRGYLLTGDPRYLEPYDAAVTEIGEILRALRAQFAAVTTDAALMSQLDNNVQRKLSEMDLSVRMRKQGNEDAWKFVLLTDVGKEQMDAIREHSAALIDHTTDQINLGQLQVQQALRFSRGGIFAVAMAALLAFYLYLRQSNALKHADALQQEALQRERDLLERQVRERTASLAELATHLQQVREDERGHLARELHDELGALLTAAKLDVARLKSRLGDAPEMQDRLHHLTQTLNSGIALKRRIIEDLRPSSLSNLGLTAALEILAREFAERSGLEVMTDLETTTLDESRQLTVYRLVQESLTNVGKYANARQVRIALHDLEHQIAVEVADDGQGFDPAVLHTSTHGLAGMRHRVEAAGGRLRLDAAPGQGTRVHAVLPKPPVADAGQVTA